MAELSASQIEDLGFQKILNKLNVAVGRANVLLTILNTTTQAGAHIASEEYALAVSEVATALISAGVGGVAGFLLGGPAGIIIGVGAGFYIEDMINSITTYM